MGTAQANTVFVTDSFEITMRTGPSNNNKIIKMLRSDAPLEVLEEQDGWIRVRARDGKEGWVLSRFTQKSLPKSIQLQRLQEKNEKLTALSGGAATQLDALEEENTSLETELAQTRRELERVNKEHAALQADTANVLKLKNEYTETKGRLDSVSARVDELSIENQELRSNTNLMWFLSGAGVISVAWLFGFIMGRIQRRKRSSIQF